MHRNGCNHAPSSFQPCPWLVPNNKWLGQHHSSCVWLQLMLSFFCSPLPFDVIAFLFLISLPLFLAVFSPFLRISCVSQIKYAILSYCKETDHLLNLYLQFWNAEAGGYCRIVRTDQQWGLVQRSLLETQGISGEWIQYSLQNSCLVANVEAWSCISEDDLIGLSGNVVWQGLQDQILQYV